jgi:hypothetical protein
MKAPRQHATGTYDGMDFLPGGSGYNLVTISGKPYYSFLNVRDMPPRGTPVAIEFEETTRLRESITSNIPCLTRLKPCPSQSPTTASGRW